MATNFDTPLATPSPSFTGEITYPDDVGPEGIEVLLEDEEEGAVEVEIPPAFEDNLAETMDPRDLQTMADDLIDLFADAVDEVRDEIMVAVLGELYPAPGTSFYDRLMKVGDDGD